MAIDEGKPLLQNYDMTIKPYDQYDYNYAKPTIVSNPQGYYSTGFADHKLMATETPQISMLKSKLAAAEELRDEYKAAYNNLLDTINTMSKALTQTTNTVYALMSKDLTPEPVADTVQENALDLI